MIPSIPYSDYYRVGGPPKVSISCSALEPDCQILMFVWSLGPTPQLPLKEPQIPSHGDHKALNRGTLGGVGLWYSMFLN